jgi:dTDP-4-dehydrorhamnose 3,5-epimerase
MSRLLLQTTPLSGVCLVRRSRQEDARGFLSRIFCADELAAVGWQGPIAQINQTVTTNKGTVRGMHFQHPPYAEWKLVSCLGGRVWDVAVDLRCGSATFLQWHAECLDAEEGTALLIPAGFAHGFQALSDNAELLYCHSHAFAPEAQGGLNPTDPRLSIRWPLGISHMSDRDAQAPLISSSFPGVDA